MHRAVRCIHREQSGCTLGLRARARVEWSGFATEARGARFYVCGRHSRRTLRCVRVRGCVRVPVCVRERACMCLCAWVCGGTFAFRVFVVVVFWPTKMLILSGFRGGRLAAWFTRGMLGAWGT